MMADYLDELYNDINEMTNQVKKKKKTHLLLLIVYFKTFPDQNFNFTLQSFSHTSSFTGWPSLITCFLHPISKNGPNQESGWVFKRVVGG